MKTIFWRRFVRPDEHDWSRPKSDLNSLLDKEMGNLPDTLEWNYQRKRLIFWEIPGKSTRPAEGTEERTRKNPERTNRDRFEFTLLISQPNRQLICSSSSLYHEFSDFWYCEMLFHYKVKRIKSALLISWRNKEPKQLGTHPPESNWGPLESKFHAPTLLKSTLHNACAMHLEHPK